jgi:hypothetical protein
LRADDSATTNPDNAAHRRPCQLDAGLLPVEDLALLERVALSPCSLDCVHVRACSEQFATKAIVSTGFAQSRPS